MGSMTGAWTSQGFQAHARKALQRGCQSRRAGAHREHPIALLLALVAVDGERRPAVGAQLPRDRVAAALGLAEHLRFSDS